MRMKSPQFSPLFIAGPVGQLDTLMLDSALDDAPRGIALVAHPNPTQGGTNTNKVVHTLAKVLSRRGYIVYCPNLRGVGKSDGEHDEGRGEVDDMQAIYDYARSQHGGLPVVLAGFSFGTFVQSQFAERLGSAAVQQMILVGPAAGRWAMPDIPAATIVVHGEQDEVVPLAAVLDWLRPQAVPVTVIPGSGHFFHGMLPVLADVVNRQIA
jgi:alpha/beta superfamily hydrolase